MDEIKKRLRISAGPNGSGKTTIIDPLRKKFNFGYYVNADDIEKELTQTRGLSLIQFKLNLNTQEVQDFFKQSTFSPAKTGNPKLYEAFTVENQELLLSEKVIINSYIAADLAEMVRQKLLETGASTFSYETVMSHPGKLDFLQKAKDAGYRVYLYFVATDDPGININRVQIRVAQEGHYVAPDTVRERYYKSLANLKAAVKLSYRAYLFDNSGEAGQLVAEVYNGSEVSLVDQEFVPAWFEKYLLG